nr:hypothetical protein [Tanacetum cinerariifolium]
DSVVLVMEVIDVGNKMHKAFPLPVASLVFKQWEQPSLAVGTYTASGNFLLAVGMPCAFYSQQSSPKLDASFALKFSRINGHLERMPSITLLP